MGCRPRLAHLQSPSGIPSAAHASLLLPGFHMAPCGCFFDPRIYRIEWATANFVQPSVYKVSSGPGPQSTYLLDGQKYLKGPVQPVPYPPYQHVASNPPFVLPFFKTEAPAGGNLMDRVSLIGHPVHSSLFADVPRLSAEGQVPSGDHALPITIPGPPAKESPGSPVVVAYEQPKGQLDPCPDLAFQVFKDFPAEDGRFKDSEGSQDFVATSPGPSVPPESLGMPGTEVTTGTGDSADLECLLTSESALLEDPEEPFSLPDKVLLEDAMKLFDCSPANSDTEVSLDDLSSGGPHGHQHDTLHDAGFSSEDSSSDIRSLNLPDELLSFDYSVPEILNAVTSLDYLYDVNAFGEDTRWEVLSSQPAPKHECQLELQQKRRSGIAASRKAKPTTGKPNLAPAQRGDGEAREVEPTLPAV
ncbi:Proline-rich protein 22 [Varanus komodoensis]|uniref:Proline rich 22 n=1 Tax=Varanus komodoensis TaxID=61221 RepID=A0A8D2JAX5_VARKO|nr:Proline-rich protein 22 [Varanus komodoensis]